MIKIVDKADVQVGVGVDQGNVRSTVAMIIDRQGGRVARVEDSSSLQNQPVPTPTI
mgnify:CR=1 FL=1